MIQAPVSGDLRRIRRVALGDYVHRSALRFGDRTAVVDGARRLTYAQLDEQSNRLAHRLLSSCPRGIAVGMLCANSAEMIVAINGIHKSGNVWVPVNVMLDAASIRYILQHAEVRVLVIDEEIAARPPIAAVVAELQLPLIVTRASGIDPPIGTPLAQAMQGQPSTLPDIEIRGDEVALLMYTSGTTGHPKGVMHSHESVQAGVASNVAAFRFDERDVVSCVLPLFHVGQHCLVATGLHVGLCIVISRGFSPPDVIEAIARERMSVFVGLPMMFGAILADPRAAGADFSSLRLCIYAMAPMPRPLVERIAARMTPNIALATGQTEIYPVTMSFHPVVHSDRDANYWGVSTNACETAIMDDDGNLLGRGVVGEIVHRGANVMLGYYKDPDATAAAQRHGWHHTGDLGLIDAGGQLLFLDRKKDMIKTGGENVASIKVESALLAHPAVAGVAVVGLPHPRWSEAVAAFVVRRPQAACDEGELEAHCRRLLAGFEVPKAIRIVEALPMTATGKMQKHLLRTQHADLFAGDEVG